MSGPFDPKRVLRLISNHLLNDLFEAHGHTLEVPWDELGENDVDPIFAAWQQLPEKDCRSIEILLREINEMAAGDEGVRAIHEEAIRQGQRQLLVDLKLCVGRHDQAAWICIRSVDVWNIAVRFARADSLSRGRYWIKRCDVPAKKTNITSANIRRFEQALSAFFQATQARGRHCRVEHYERGNGCDYFFAYLDDYADAYMTLDDDGKFDRRPERRAFEVVLAYDCASGALEMHARGGKKVAIPLQQIFCRVMLGQELRPESSDSHPYELNGLLNRSFRFPTDPRDGVESVRVVKMRVSIKGSPRRRITLEADPERQVDDIHVMLNDFLNRERLPKSVLNVTQVALKFAFDGSNGDLPKSLSFELSYPNSSNLKSKPEKVRLLVEKYLRKWRLDRAPSPQDAQSVA